MQYPQRQEHFVSPAAYASAPQGVSRMPMQGETPYYPFSAAYAQPRLDLPVVEIIKNRLYWSSGMEPPESDSEAFFYSVDQELQYDPFNSDFGPLTIAQVHKYVRELVRLLVDPQFKKVKLYHYCSSEYDKQANSAFLMGAFMLIVLKMKTEKIANIFKSYSSIVVPYRDASYGECYYPCTVD